MKKLRSFIPSTIQYATQTAKSLAKTKCWNSNFTQEKEISKTEKEEEKDSSVLELGIRNQPRSNCWNLEKLKTLTGYLIEFLMLKKTRAEFETASKLSHPNILKVLHLFRYQETEKIEKFWSLQNWTVIVMQKHEKNIGELLAEERNYLPGLFRDVLGYIYKIIWNMISF